MKTRKNIFYIRVSQTFSFGACNALLFLLLFGQTQEIHGEPSFTGQSYSVDSDLFYFRARYYDPETGTFLTKDPLGVQSDPNMYRYANNDPVNKVDPEGTWLGIDDAIALGGGALIGLAGQGIGDLIRGELSGWEDYTAAAVGGAVTGETLLYTLPTTGPGAFFIAGAAGSASANLTRQGLNNLTGRQNGFDGGSFVTETAVGTVASGVLGVGGQKLGQVISNGTSPLTVMVGAGARTSPSVPGFHVAYQIDDQIIHGAGNRLGDLTVEVASPSQSRIFQSSYSSFDIPIINPSAAAQTGQSALTCVTACGSAVLRGWSGGSATGGQVGTVLGFGTTQALDFTQNTVGGVLIDQAAQLINGNLSDIQGATFDPISQQLIFLGSDTTSSVEPINLDYLFTAIQAVYGSAVPPLVSLDPPAGALTEWINFGNGDNVFEPNEWGGFVIRYNPVWSGEDTTVDIKVEGQSGGTPFEWEARFDAVALDGPPITISAGGRFAMKLVFNSWISAPPAGVTLDNSPFFSGSISGWSLTLNSNSQDSYFQFNLFNGSAQNYVIENVTVLPARQHRRFGGRVEDTRLGWVMYEADRVMKCLGIGKDNLTGADYNGATISIPGYQNFVERIQSTGQPGGNIRMWFVPNEMTLERHVDEATGQATIVFDQATVALLTESYIQGLPQSPVASAFTQHFNANYDAFAQLEFPVQDPDDPTGATIINVRIFEMLREVMQAVSLARFMRDNDIPVDLWWLDSWQPPLAYIPRSTPTAMNEDSGIVIFGGVEVNKPNDYVPSILAQNVGTKVCSSRPNLPANLDSDIDEQFWTSTTGIGSVRAVASSTNPESQDGNLNIKETDLLFKSPGDVPLEFTRYYQSSYLGENHLGPGWRMTRFVLEFSRPSWFDEQELLLGNGAIPLETVSGDTQLRSGVIRVMDLAGGTFLEFVSSLEIEYGIDELGNAELMVSGLDSNNVPLFTGINSSDGSTLVQNPSDKSYKLNTPQGFELIFRPDGQLFSITDRNGYQQTYNYNADNCLERITDGASQEILINYNAENKVSFIMGPGSERVDYSYDAEGCLQTATHQRSSVTVTYSYNARCQLDGKNYFNGLSAFAGDPDLKGRSTSNDDQRGNTFSNDFTYGATTDTKKTTITDPVSSFSPWESEWDRYGRLLMQKEATGAMVSYGYDTGSMLPNQIVLPVSGRSTIDIERNGSGRIIEANDLQDIGGQPVQITYNSSGNQETLTDHAGRLIEYDWTLTQDLACVRKYLSGTPVEMNLGYQNGFLRTFTNQRGKVTTLNRDTVGRVTSVVDATGVTTGFEYDSLGRLWRIDDPKFPSKIVFTYDNTDRIKTIETPVGTFTYTYNVTTGFLEEIEDAIGRVTRYEHDIANGDVIKIIHERNSGDAETVIGYNRFGQMNAMTASGASQIDFGIDDLGRATSITQSVSAVPGPPKALDSNNADDGVPTGNTSHIFTWGAPDSDTPIVGYSYTLNGILDDTIDSTVGTATYTDLTPGTYIFEVKAQTANGIWSDVATFTLIIDPNAVIPTMTEWGVIALIIVLLLVAIRQLKANTPERA